MLSRHVHAVGVFATAVAMLVLAGGCQTPVTVQPPVDGGGNPPVGDATQPIVNFTSPTESADVNDLQQIMVKYRVISQRPTTVKLLLDTDTNPGNMNEMDLAPIRSYSQPNPTDEVPLVAARYPYGSYWIRAIVSDGQHEETYLASGTVRIVPSSLNPGEDPGTTDLAGLEIVYTSGEPVTVNGKIPFADLWWELDPLDNLAPRVIMPIEVTEPIQISRMQAFTYGRTDVMPRRFEIYQGTDENSEGTLIHQFNEDKTSHFGGKWVTMTLSPPVTLQPGKYGISYHSRFEFTERVAGNSPIGAGFVWVSPVGGAPFAKLDAEVFGFTPNFAIRLLGKHLNSSSARAKEPTVLPKAPRLVYRNGDERAVFAPHEDELMELLPQYHVSWREVLPQE
ncbi:MAG: hypothetical protein HUU22_13375 [Phycisphaerae bacterium]|nr:hypothetical protein [Phycisphaerae bacterium]NUQ47011.1 hypothetical protein [Phycisphaerae bacterium]